MNGLTKRALTTLAPAGPKNSPLSGKAINFRGHLPALDGLRGIAILLVLAVHFYDEGFIQINYPTMGPILTKFVLMGLDGVELFFVLSGYLITGILLDSKGSSTNFFRFYARRFLRIFPLYYAALFLVFAVAPFVVTFDSAAHEIARRQGWLWSYLSNLPVSGGCWDDSETFKLGHFWSLCVEEHYYLVWPAVVALCPNKHLVKTCILLLGVACSIRFLNAVLGPHTPWVLNWSTFTKLDGLVLGSLVAILVRRTTSQTQFRWVPKLALLFGLVFLAFALLPRRMQATILVYRVFHESVSVGFFASVLLLALKSGISGPFGGLLSQPWLMAFGKYSYGIYVIHGLIRPGLHRLFPIETLVQTVHSPLLAQCAYYLLATSVTFGASLFTYHLFERRFLDLKDRFSPRGKGLMTA